MLRNPFEKLKYRLFVPTALATVALCLVSAVVSYNVQVEQAERNMRDSASVVAESLGSVWDFMQINQDRINYNSEGIYDFKGLHCSIVGLSVGSLLSKRTDYTIRYTSDAPRNLGHTSDAFEAEALAAFRADPALQEYAAIGEFGGERSHRYAVPLVMGEECVECHGSPAGEIDVTGYPREGYGLDYVMGVLSVTQPTASYDRSIMSNLTRELVQVLLMLVAGFIVIFLFASRWVTTPIERLGRAAQRIGRGDMDVELGDLGVGGEIDDLRRCFEQMVRELKELYGGLETKVEERTAQILHMNDVLETKTRELELANARLAEESRSKTDFLSMVSHELRTPLTTSCARRSPRSSPSLSCSRRAAWAPTTPRCSKPCGTCSSTGWCSWARLTRCSTRRGSRPVARSLRWTRSTWLTW